MTKKLISVLFCLFVLFIFGQTVCHAAHNNVVNKYKNASTETKKQAIFNLNKQREAAHNKIRSLRVLEKLESGKLYNNQRRLETTRNDLVATQRECDRKLNELNRMKAQKSVAEVQYVQIYSGIKTRIQQIYKTQRKGFLELLLTSTDVNMFFDRLHFESIIMKEDYKRMQQARRKAEEIAGLEHSIALEQQSLDKSRRTLLAQQRAIKSDIAYNKKMINKLKTNRAYYERTEDELARQSASLEAMLAHRSASMSSDIKVTTGFIKPVGGPITSPFGYRVHPIFKTRKFHSGIDIGAPMNAPIKASNTGKVQHISEDNADVLWDYQKILLKKVRKEDKDNYVCHLLGTWYNEKRISAVNLSKNLDDIDKIVSKDGINIWEMVKEYEEYNVEWKYFEPFIKKHSDEICKYRIKCDEAEVDAKLAEFSLQQLQEVEYVPALKLGEYKLMEYTNKLQESTKQPLTLPLYNVLITRLKEVKDHDISIDSLNNIGILTNIMQGAKNDESFGELRYDLLAIALVRIDYNNLQSQPAFSGYLASNDMELAKKIAGCIEYYMDFDNILLRAKDMKQSILYQHVCQVLTSEEQGEYLDLLVVTPKFQQIVDATNIDKHDLANCFSLWKWEKASEVQGNEIEKVITRQFLQYTKDIVENDFVIGARSRVLQYLKGLSQDEWKKYLQQGIESYGICIGLLLKFEWTDAAMLAVKEFFEETAKNKQSLGQRKQWDNLIVSLQKSGKSLKQTFGNVYDQLKDGKISPDVFKFWADWIFEADVIKPDEATLRRFMPEQFLEDRDCVKIMLRHKETVKAIYLAAKEERKDFEIHLLGLLERQQKVKEDDGNEIMNELRELAQALDISLSSIPESDSIDD